MTSMKTHDSPARRRASRSHRAPFREPLRSRPALISFVVASDGEVLVARVSDPQKTPITIGAQTSYLSICVLIANTIVLLLNNVTTKIFDYFYIEHTNLCAKFGSSLRYDALSDAEMRLHTGGYRRKSSLYQEEKMAIKVAKKEVLPVIGRVQAYCSSCSGGGQCGCGPA